MAGGGACAADAPAALWADPSAAAVSDAGAASLTMLLAAATAGEIEGALEELEADAGAAGLRIPDDHDGGAPVAAAAVGLMVARLLAAEVGGAVAMLGAVG